MTHALVIATANRGKLEELRGLLGGLPLRLFSLEDVLRQRITIVEDGKTFAENAVKKARTVAHATVMLTLADDSGLEVDALGGGPGVHSARYAGLGATDAANNAKLLEALRDVAPAQRSARFRCVAAFVDPARRLEVTRVGACEGRLLDAPRGTAGFGYDPLFLLPDRGLTMAELPLDEKNRLSHRAAAFRALAQALDAIRS